MALTYVTVTGSFDDGSGTPLAGYAAFTPSQTVYAAGIPLVTVGAPVIAQITAGALAATGLLATDNTGLEFLGQTGFFYWTVQLTLGGQAQPSWSFFLPSSPASVDLFELAGTGPSVSGLLFGAGVPAGGLGAAGDYYFRSDGGTGTHVYFKTGASAWTAII